MTNYKFARQDKYSNTVPHLSEDSVINKIIHALDIAKEKSDAFNAYVNSPEFERKTEIIEKAVEDVGMTAIHGTRNAIKFTAAVAGNSAMAGLLYALGDKTGAKGSLKKAGVAVKNRAINTVKSAKTITSHGKYYFVHWNELPPEIKAKAIITTIGTVVGAYVAAGMIHSLGIPTISIGDAMEIPMLIPDMSDVDYIDNGEFVGDADDLQNLIMLGEKDGTIHVEADRNLSAVEQFYAQHGLSHESGYEVHHIIPLSQGGADVPENMVLIRSDLHHQITAAHDAFYGWHS